MPSPNGVHTVLFDLDGTLRHNRPDATKAFFSKAVDLGLPISNDDRQAAIQWAYAYWADSEDLKRDQATYRGDEPGFWRHYSIIQLEAYGCPRDRAEAAAPDIHAYMAEEFAPEDVVPDDVPGTLASLKETGLTLAVVSNRRSPFGDYLNELGIGDYFDFSLAAGEIEVWKPDPEIFHHAIRRAGSTPEQAIYVGDNYYADVLGARKAGIRPILIDRDDIFPDADCEVIPSLDKLIDMVG